MRKRNVILFVVFLLVAIAVVVGVYLGLVRRQQGTFLNPLPELKVQVVYATEEGEWMRAAAERFNQDEHVVNGQRIVVELIPMDSGEALIQIKDGVITPTAWSPASMLWVNALNDEWQVQHATDLVMRVGQYQATPLVLSPMVFVMWEDRYQAFKNYFKADPDWGTIQQAVTAPEGWKTLGGNPDWGFVKFGQADPIYSNSGLVAITLATYDHYGKTRGLTPEYITSSEFKNWVQPLWLSIVGSYDRTSSDLMQNMLRYGPSTYDVIMVYENLVASYMKNASGRWGEDLHVFYPRLNLWNDHPYCVLLADWTTADQKDAALEFQKFLLSEEIQSQALRYGFRPANVDVPVVNSDPENPFNKYQAQGLQIQIPRMNLVEVPSADVINQMQLLFKQTTR
jgi:hypothetical protein